MTTPLRVATQTAQLKETVKHLEKAHKIFTAMGVAKTNIRKLDEAKAIIEHILEKGNKKNEQH